LSVHTIAHFGGTKTVFTAAYLARSGIERRNRSTSELSPIHSPSNPPHRDSLGIEPISKHWPTFRYLRRSRALLPRKNRVCPRRESKTNSQSRSSSEGRTSSHICTQTLDPRFSVGLQNRAPMSARAVAVIRPAPIIVAPLAFLFILSSQRQLHAFQYRPVFDDIGDFLTDPYSDAPSCEMKRDHCSWIARIRKTRPLQHDFIVDRYTPMPYNYRH
jgi:hypothetical protein